MTCNQNRRFDAAISEAGQDSLASFVDLKLLAQKLLPPHSAVRRLILSEPDTMSRERAVAKVEIFSRMLLAELGG